MLDKQLHKEKQKKNFRLNNFKKHTKHARSQ